MSYATMCCVTAYYSVLPLLLAINLAIGALYNELGNRVQVPYDVCEQHERICFRPAQETRDSSFRSTLVAKHSCLRDS